MLALIDSNFPSISTARIQDQASVLVVDDDAVAGEELAEALELEGFACTAATTWDEALSILAATPTIEFVITDFYLRGDDMATANGLDLIDHIRAIHPTRKLDFVVISGDRDVLADCVVTGAGNFLAKPISPESISALIRKPSDKIPEAAGAADNEAELVKLHRMIEAQAGAISELSKALNESRRDKREATSRLDRLVDAASIAERRSDDGQGDVNNLIRYIVGQGFAVRGLLANGANSGEAPSS